MRGTGRFQNILEVNKPRNYSEEDAVKTKPENVPCSELFLNSEKFNSLFFVFSLLFSQ
jgi:hypothetical protein